MIRFLLALLVSVSIPIACFAQEEQAVLVADEIRLTAQGNLIATGNIEISYLEYVVTAQEIIYDSKKDDITFNGGLFLTDPKGDTIRAEQATLDRSLQNGILQSARLTLDQQLNLDAAQMQRADGNLNTLTTVAATSCQVCGTKPPLWQIRAKRVVHDETTKQIHFYNAHLRVMDVPVFYLPYMRLPDPTVERMQGFLPPTGHSNSTLGFGIKLPYFIPISQDKDITLTPYLSSETRTLEVRYRQAYDSGRITVNGAVSQDTLNPNTRAYIKAKGAFTLPQDYRLSFTAQSVSDTSYLGDYEYGTSDRLESKINITKTTRNSYRALGVSHYYSLYNDDGTLSDIVSYNEFIKHFYPVGLGGKLTLSAELQSNLRVADGDGPTSRDMARLNGAALWRRSFAGPSGITAGLSAQARYDVFNIQQDSAYPQTQGAFTADLMADLRWPWLKYGAAGQVHLIEPMAQIGYSGRQTLDLPNEESTRVEYDAANLLSLSRFPAPDRYENGLRGALGVRYAYRGDKLSAGVTLGRVYRETPQTDFSKSSGLQGSASDYMLGVSVALRDTFSLKSRALVSDTGDVTKAEALGRYSTDKWKLDLGYSLLKADVLEERNDTISEWTLGSSYKVNDTLTVTNTMRYDIAASATSRAGLGLVYSNECVNVDFSVSRRFTVSGTSQPLTSYGLRIELKGFSTGGAAQRSTRSCQD